MANAPSVYLLDSIPARIVAPEISPKSQIQYPPVATRGNLHVAGGVLWGTLRFRFLGWLQLLALGLFRPGRCEDVPARIGNRPGQAVAELSGDPDVELDGVFTCLRGRVALGAQMGGQLRCKHSNC
jgi:hypothetical protein